VEITTHQHAAVFTVEENRALRGELAGGHCKCLFLKDKKGALWLVVALEDRAVDMKALRHVIGSAPLSFAKPELLRQVLGVEPGSVTPFALINDRAQAVNVVLDEEMMDYDLLNYHPLINTATTTIGARDLLEFIGACGHQPQILKI
jgi:Ala-tRNA(Pro) deacylase